jgi:ribose-phosphate pyrophosphokinase
MPELKLFAGRSNRRLAEKIAQRIGVPLGECKIENFSDGEIWVKYSENIRGTDVFIVQSTNPPAEQMMELLIMVDAAKRASARKVTTVIPYFGYARQDRKDQPRVAITAKLMANLLTASGVDRVIAMDLHAPQIQGFFDIPVDHLQAAPAFNRHFQNLDYSRVTIVSPDVGNMKRARTYAERMGCELAVIDKRRTSGSTAVIENIIGTVEGRDVLMIDDMIATAGTVCEAARIVKNRGARSVRAAATHAVFAGPCFERLQQAPLSEIVVTDTIPVSAETRALVPALRVLTVADILGEAISRIHKHQSVSSLFNRA